MNRRFEIFDKYTFSSVNAQTNKDFTWVILLNGKTPQKFKDKITEYENSASMRIKLVYVDNYDNIISKIKNISNILSDEFKNYKSKWLLTCRCDNDDMLAKDYGYIRRIDNKINHFQGSTANEKSLKYFYEFFKYVK